MELKMHFTSSKYAKNHCRYKKKSPFGGWNHEGIQAVHFRGNIHFCTTNGLHQNKSTTRSFPNLFSRRAAKSTKQPVDDSVDESEKKGTIVGAVALIIGTSIGSGILALPQKTSPAGFIPSSLAIILCWGFLLIEALLLAEINSSLLREKGKTEGQEIEVLSIRTMAQDTLGDWGGTLATVNYVFLGYTTMVAYTSKSGELLNHLSNIPSNISGFFFTVVFTILISIGGTRTTDQVNQWMTVTMIALLVSIEVLAIWSGGWSGFEVSGNWSKVPSAIPVIIFTLVYHDLAPFICAYLGGDLARIRVSFIFGSVVPLLVLLVWDAVALGLSAHADQVVDPVDLLMRVRWSGVSGMVEAFSLLAVGTSLLGTLLSFSRFFLEQLSNVSMHSSSTQLQVPNRRSEPSILKKDGSLFSLKKWWGGNKLSITAMVIAVAPPLFISTTLPDVFSAATDIAGGYCMTVLYGVLPPAMAFAMHARTSDDIGSSNDHEENNHEDKEESRLSKVKPALIAVGLFACAIVVEQILQDLSALHL